MQQEHTQQTDKNNRTGSQASRHPTSTALCGAPHIVRPAPPRSVRTNRRHAAERHDREGSLAEPPGPEERSPKRRYSLNVLAQFFLAWLNPVEPGFTSHT